MYIRGYKPPGGLQKVPRGLPEIFTENVLSAFLLWILSIIVYIWIFLLNFSQYSFFFRDQSEIDANHLGLERSCCHYNILLTFNLTNFKRLCTQKKI